MFINPKENYIPLNERPVDDRPREKMKAHGKQSLSNAEILAILIGSGTNDKSAVELSREILNKADNCWHRLGRITLPELLKFRGIGEAKAITIMAAMELARRREAKAVKVDPIIRTASDIFHLMRDRYLNLDHEEFHILLLNGANHVIHVERISTGGWSGTVVDGRMVFRSALLHGASKVILTHNHPSGILKPSRKDLNLTKDFKRFGDLIGLPIMDHVIITDKNFYSFVQENTF